MYFDFRSCLFSVFVSVFLNVKDSKWSTNENEPTHNTSVMTDDAKRIDAYVFKPENMNKNTEFVLILHGTGCSRGSYGSGSQAQILRKMGYCLVIPDYRGFASSEGDFDVQGANLDVLACFKHIASEFGTRKVHIVGHSFGSAVAAEYCRYAKENSIRPEYHPTKIVMLSPFTSVPRLLREFYAWKFVSIVFPWLKERIASEFEYNTLENIKCIDSRKVSIYHVKNDTLVPCEHSLEIAERYNIFFKLTEHDHFNIINDGSIWNDIYGRISDAV